MLLTVMYINIYIYNIYLSGQWESCVPLLVYVCGVVWHVCVCVCVCVCACVCV